MNAPITPNSLPTTTPARLESQSTSLLLDPILFAHAQRAAALFASSQLFPGHLKNGTDKAQHVANAVMVLNIAQRMREDPLMVAQNIYFVSQKPGWATSYMIARANTSQIFRGRITWDTKGSGDAMSVTAKATLSDTGEVVTATVDYAMAKAEGWIKNTKYQTMREHMLRMRSATMLIRLYCPEVMLGIQTTDELEDIRASEARDVTPLAAAAAQIGVPATQTDLTPVNDAHFEDAVVEEVTTSTDTPAPMSDAAVALESGLRELKELNTIAAGADLNDDMKRTLAGTPEIGVWNSEYLQWQGRMKQSGHK